MKSYCVYNLVWDIVSRPLYKGLATKKYIRECLNRGLPLPLKEYKFDAIDEKEVISFIEAEFKGYKLKQYTIYEAVK